MLCIEVDENQHKYYIKKKMLKDTMTYLWTLVVSIFLYDIILTSI